MTIPTFWTAEPPELAQVQSKCVDFASRLRSANTNMWHCMKGMCVLAQGIQLHTLKTIETLVYEKKHVHSNRTCSHICIFQNMYIKPQPEATSMASNSLCPKAGSLVPNLFESYVLAAEGLKGVLQRCF